MCIKDSGGNDATTNRINNLDGMTLRDYFAGQALAGSMACQITLTGCKNTKSCAMVALICYKLADEMLKQRKY